MSSFGLIFSVLLINLICHVLGGVQDPRYLTTCGITDPHRGIVNQHDCHVALFSNKLINFNGGIVVVEHDLCSLEFAGNSSFGSVSALNLAVLVKRGKCAFSTKAKYAQDAGFKLVIIANSEEEGFPVGPPELDFVLEIPVMMAGQRLWDELSAKEGSNQVMEYIVNDGGASAENSDRASTLALIHKLSVVFEPHSSPPSTTSTTAQQSSKDPPMPHPVATHNARIVRGLFTIAAGVSILILVAVFTTTLQHHLTCTPTQTITPTTPSFTTYTVQLLVYVLIVVVFVATRLGTLRIHSTDTEEVVYNHRETDERVFEALVNNVLRDPLDYRLHTRTIQELQLAEENYSDSVFIHPPLFVYTSAVLYKYCGVPLPLVPVLFQVVTLCLLPVICTYSLSCIKYAHIVSNTVRYSSYFTAGDIYYTSVLSMLLLCCCPIAAFSSQKFWIDNCLMMSVTACAAAHVYLLHNSESGNGDSSALHYYVLFKHALSGLVFGLVGLNCKITAAALLLFAVGYIMLQQYTHYLVCYRHLVSKEEMSSVKHTVLLRSTVRNVFLYCAVFGVCSALAYAPWMYIYWVHTGRLTPNAWPSATMLQRSSFVRAAVLKPWHTYLRTLLTTAPVHMVGVVGAVVLGVYIVRGVLVSACRGVFVLCGGAISSTTHDWVDPVVLTVLVLSLWPLGFLVGLTLLGSLGSGFQSRFLMPMLPGSAILSAVCVVWMQRSASTSGGDTSRMQVMSIACNAVVLVYMMYSVMHVLYYCVLYAPLYADLDVSVVDVIVSVLQSAYHSPQSRESFQDTLKFMSHFGLLRDSK